MIDVISTGAPSSMVKISGDNQSAVVNSNLTSELVVEIRDSGGNPIQGQNISMAATAGGGSIISSNPQASDVNGRASFMVRVGTSSGSANNIFRATATSAPSVYVDFSASATPVPQAP